MNIQNYATDTSDIIQTSDAHHRLMPPPYWGRGIINERIQLVRLQLSKLGLIDNLQIYNLLLSCMELYFAYSGHRTCTGLPIPYVLPVTGEYSSTRLATRRVLE